jgi:Na+/H+-dicarboxylate symporter
MGARVGALTTLIVQINGALLSFIMVLMKVAPFGIFCLVTARFGEAQAAGSLAAVLQQTGAYFGTVLAGLAVHACVTLPLILWMFTRRNPFRFMSQMSEALLTAFSTASSTVTLPITMNCATEKAAVSKQSVDFVVPLGATINMDGTALYEAVAAIFIAQAIGVELTITSQAVVAVTATMAAIGAAGIPEAGLVTMVIVLNAVGLPLEYIGLILSVDWLLDRFRTAVNVFGDAVGSAVVDESFRKQLALSD